MLYWTDAAADWTPSVSYFQDLVVGDVYGLFFPWKNRLWPVGWLEPEHPYPIGPLAFEDLQALAEALVNPVDLPVSICGSHYCGFCEHAELPMPYVQDFGDLEIEVGRRNFFYPGKGRKVYSVPSLIIHYILEHGYCPPQEFLDAVRTGPKMRSAAYYAAMTWRRACVWSLPTLGAHLLWSQLTTSSPAAVSREEWQARQLKLDPLFDEKQAAKAARAKARDDRYRESHQVEKALNLEEANLADCLDDGWCQGLSQAGINLQRLKQQSGNFPFPQHFPDEEFWRSDLGVNIFEGMFLQKGKGGQQIIVLRAVLASEGPAAEMLRSEGVTDALLVSILENLPAVAVAKPSKKAMQAVSQQLGRFLVKRFTQASLNSLGLALDWVWSYNLRQVSEDAIFLASLLTPYSLENPAVQVLHQLRALAPLHFFYPGLQFRPVMLTRPTEKRPKSYVLSNSVWMLVQFLRSLSTQPLGPQHLLGGIIPYMPSSEASQILQHLGLTAEILEQELKALDKRALR